MILLITNVHSKTHMDEILVLLNRIYKGGNTKASRILQISLDTYLNNAVFLIFFLFLAPFFSLFATLFFS